MSLRLPTVHVINYFFRHPTISSILAQTSSNFVLTKKQQVLLKAIPPYFFLILPSLFKITQKMIVAQVQN